MKKKGYWVFLSVMALVGVLLISNYCFQRSPVVPDVNARMSQYNNMGSFSSIGSYNLGDIGSYGALSSYGMAANTGLICDL